VVGKVGAEMESVQQSKAGQDDQPGSIKPAFGRLRQRLSLREMKQNMGKKVSRVTASIPLLDRTPKARLTDEFLKRRFGSA
jgi:hypothetical protein